MRRVQKQGTPFNVYYVPFNKWRIKIAPLAVNDVCGHVLWCMQW